MLVPFQRARLLAHLHRACAAIDQIELYNFAAPDTVRAWWADLELLPF